MPEPLNNLPAAGTVEPGQHTIVPTDIGGGTGSSIDPNAKNAQPREDEKPIGLFTRAVRGVKDAAADTYNSFTNRNDPNYWKKRTLENGGKITSDKRKKTEPWDPVKAWRKSGAFTQTTSETATLSPFSVLMRRGGSIPKNAVELSNENKAHLALMNGTPAAPGEWIAQFDYFILTNITMQDQERVDVVETFGAPHIFASGRFVRRYQFSGYMHTVPLRTRVTGREAAADYVPPIFAWKSFYEQYVRATKSAQNDVFVRVTTPAGDIFDGYIVATSDNRDSSLETTTPFAFQMIVINESDTWGSNKLFNNLIAPKKKQTDTVNKAELNVAVGEFDMKVAVGSGTPGPSARTDLGRIKPDGSPEGTIPELTLECSHSGYILNTTSKIRGLTLEYADKAAVHGSQSRSGKVPLTVRVTDYSALRQAFIAGKGIDNRGMTTSIVISNGANKSVTVEITFIASEKILMEIRDVGVLAEDGTPARGVYSKGADNLCTVAESWLLFDANTCTGTLAFRIAPRGTDEPLKGHISFSATPVARTWAYKGANKVDPRAQAQSSDQKPLSTLAITPGGMTYDIPNATFNIPFTLTGPGPMVDGDDNPIAYFVGVDGIGGDFMGTIGGDLYEEFRFIVSFCLQMAPRGPIGSALDPAKCAFNTTNYGLYGTNATTHVTAYLVPKEELGLSSQDMLGLMNGGTFTFSVATSIYSFTLTPEERKTTIRIGSDDMVATASLSADKNGSVFARIVISPPTDAIDAESEARIRRVRALLDTAGRASYSQAGNDPSKVELRGGAK